jgi:DnaJ-class molecular chaperone
MEEEEMRLILSTNNLYRILSVSNDAEEKEIKKAYRKVR